jgi:hypothetical protein
MTMADIWLTPAAEAAFKELQVTAPRQATAVAKAIDDIPRGRGRPLNIPGAPPAEPFLASEPEDREAPVVIHRHATGDEPGKWLVVSLMDRNDYHAALAAELALAAAPPAIRAIVNAAVVGTVSTVSVTAPPGGVSTQAAGAATTVVGPGTPNP